MVQKESDYQFGLRKRIENVYLPGSFVLKNDSGFLQGIPDLTVFWFDMYAILEVKRSEKEPYQPNQEYYLEKFAGMSFSATIYPENEKEVMDALQRAFLSRRQARRALTEQGCVDELRQGEALPCLPHASCCRRRNQAS